MAQAARPRPTSGRAVTPLWIVSLFLTLTETVLGVAVIQTVGGVQIALTVFVLTRLLFKAAGTSWHKSTKAMDVGTGCMVQVSNEILNPDGSVSVAEALAFVPGVRIEEDGDGRGRHLRPMEQAA
jgi:hypothetical protein